MKLVTLIKMHLNETHSGVCIGKYLCDNFSIQKWSKMEILYRHCFLALLWNMPLIRNVQKKQVGLKVNGTHHLLVYADDVNLLGDKIDNIKKNTETSTDADKEVGLEINVEETKYFVTNRGVA
jgi:hypothetical protein